MIAIGFMVAMIILASAVHKYVDRRTKGSIPTEAEERLMDRMDKLEQRLTDIQDIMIAVDDKMCRPEMKV